MKHPPNSNMDRSLSTRFRESMPLDFSWTRALLPALIAPILSHCGSVPGPGPTAEQIARRSNGVEVRTFQTHDGKELAYVVHRPGRLNS